MGEWTYRIGFALCLVLVVALVAVFLLRPPPKQWIIYPNEEGLILKGTVTIEWDPRGIKTENVKIWWTNRTKCDPDMEPCWQLWEGAKMYGPLKLIAEVPNNGEYEWDTTQYPNGDNNYIHITDPKDPPDYRDTSDYPFAIQN
ncbi:MAG: hypothetical protein ACE5J6_00155 [Candidatus Bathyarchaeia archaeon]